MSHNKDKKYSSKKSSVGNERENNTSTNINDIDNIDNIDNLNKQNIETKKKLPLKSINNRRCLSKCYSKGETYLHPVILTEIIDRENNTCAVDPVHSKDPKYHREYDMIFADKCRPEDNKIYQPPNELESLLLSFYFNPNDFLINIYGLYSFDQVIYWTLENDHLPFDTIKRVHNCAWKVYGNKIEELSSGVMEYYFDISKTYWLKNYIKNIQNDYSFDFISKKSVNEVTDSFSEIYNIIRSKYYTFDFFVNAIKRYIYEFQDKWELIDVHYGRIKKYIFNQLIESIESDRK